MSGVCHTLCTHREFADSKVLTPEKRDSLFEEISGDPDIGYCAEILSAQFISACMLSRDRISLNLMAMESTYKIIQTILSRGYKVTKVAVLLYLFLPLLSAHQSLLCCTQL